MVEKGTFYLTMDILLPGSGNGLVNGRKRWKTTRTKTLDACNILILICVYLV
jgi:hypothetical protein